MDFEEKWLFFWLAMGMLLFMFGYSTVPHEIRHFAYIIGWREDIMAFTCGGAWACLMFAPMIWRLLND